MSNPASAIANEFLKKPSALGKLTQMQLQKLAYIAHGWTLAITGDPLVNEPVQAWDYGPVFPELYDHTKLYGKSPVTRLVAENDDNAPIFFLGGADAHGKPYVAELGLHQADIINRVWNKYGHLTGIQLSELTHRPGTPWYKTYVQGEGKNTVIDNNLIRQHYLELAHAAV